MGISIRAIAADAMVSKTSIVSLEHGKHCRPSTLVKVCKALGIHVGRLVTPQLPECGPCRVHRAVDDRTFNLEDIASPPSILDISTPAQVESTMVTFDNIPSYEGILAGRLEVTSRTAVRSHRGRELVYVLSGSARVTVRGEEFLLTQGDSIFILDREEHSYASADGKAVAKLLIVRVD